MKTIVLLFFSLLAFVSISAQDKVTSGASATLEIPTPDKDKADDIVKAESEADAKPVKENAWKTLSKITYRKEYDEIMGFKIDKPVFSNQVEALAGKEITIKGYVIPVEGYKSHKEFIFSAFPYSMCFFCGGAGPETVMEVVASEAVKYSAEQITLKGTLQLNADDINRLMYQLVDATLVN